MGKTGCQILAGESVEHNQIITYNWFVSFQVSGLTSSTLLERTRNGRLYVRALLVFSTSDTSAQERFKWRAKIWIKMHCIQIVFIYFFICFFISDF